MKHVGTTSSAIYYVVRKGMSLCDFALQIVNFRAFQGIDHFLTEAVVLPEHQETWSDHIDGDLEAAAEATPSSEIDRGISNGQPYDVLL